jgi:hypothetical protein
MGISFMLISARQALTGEFITVGGEEKAFFAEPSGRIFALRSQEGEQTAFFTKRQGSMNTGNS